MGIEDEKAPSISMSIKPPSVCPSIESAALDQVLELESGNSSSIKEILDPNIVFWDGPNDQYNPQNWRLRKKGVNILVLSILTFLTPLASSMFAPGVPQLMKEFGTDNDLLATFVVSVYILGWALGPLIIAPMSELYGRVPVYHICNIGYICFTVACALANSMTMLIVFRFLQGCWSVAPLTIGAGSLSDMVAPQHRGAAMSLWSVGPLLGPVAGPIAGGFLSEAKGWRWIFWVIAIASGVTAIAAPFLLSESYAPVLLERKAKRLRRETGNANLRSKLDKGLGPEDLFSRAIVRPSKLLAMSPICQLLSLYIAILYGIMYVLFTTFTFVFEDNYGFTESSVGLTYIGIGVGMLAGLGVYAFTADRIYVRLARKHNGEYKPEFRLPPLLVTTPAVPIGMFIYGWTAQYKVTSFCKADKSIADPSQVHWIAPIIGTAFVGKKFLGITPSEALLIIPNNF